MDKLLAMSILSSSPAEIAGFWVNFPAICRKKTESNSVEDGDVKARGKGNDRRPPVKQERGRPSLAPEFDGLNCFETIVSY
ncbi:hypothetical protein AXF42_Ash009663 [Apostasia shenzhenica]|uniref:Uncharacterized protein n=1 Tax=Apostasia shenzhenica TaxID=1088818 RepID=A0A2I0AWS1_9ASPA|nr:hypothetical protein AXF42_Ash009663 [Apostasia shenzhenica]